MTELRESIQKTLQGVAVSQGIVIGKAQLLDRTRVKITHRILGNGEVIKREVVRFKQALKTTEKQLVTLRDRMPDQVKAHAFILDAYLMILKDAMLKDATVERIKKERINAEWALKKSLEELRKIFDQIEDDYIKSRIVDVENVTERILRNLCGESNDGLSGLNERVIVVAHDLTPTDTSDLNLGKVMGFITDVGGRTSHAAIMAQALQIPVIVGLESATAKIKDGDLLIIDGNTGVVIIEPDDRAIIEYQEKQLLYEAYKIKIARTSHLPAVTVDKHRISVKANMEFLEEVVAIKDLGAEGVGLYRTEFLYLKGDRLPDEEELFEEYRDVAEIIAPNAVSIRTLDLGGDKLASFTGMHSETNPALGLRAIRLCLREPEIFKTQLRAILRASIYGKLKLMFPMISGVKELLDAKAILDEVRREMDRDAVDYDHDMSVGIMIEVPSAVTMAEVLARHVDFFSIGTNDLIQYALAIDRVNEHLADMYQPFHPAILRMIRQTVEAGRKAGIEISLCGEMAGDPLCVAILIGTGINELSMNARAIPQVKKMIRSLSLKEVREDFENVFQMSTAVEVRNYLQERLQHRFPGLKEKGFFEA